MQIILQVGYSVQPKSESEFKICEYYRLDSLDKSFDFQMTSRLSIDHWEVTTQTRHFCFRFSFEIGYQNPKKSSSENSSSLMSVFLVSYPVE